MAILRPPGCRPSLNLLTSGFSPALGVPFPPTWGDQRQVQLTTSPQALVPRDVVRE